MILDVTCSSKRRWPAQADLRFDRDPSARPDVVADAGCLPLPDASVDELYCDPPHMVKSYASKSGRVFLDKQSMAQVVGPKMEAKAHEYRRFGLWPSMVDYFQFLDRCDAEWARVIKPGGLVHYKTTDGSRSHGTTIRRTDAIARLTRFELVAEEREVSRGFFAKLHAKKHGTVTYTYYLTFRRRDATVTPTDAQESSQTGRPARTDEYPPEVLRALAYLGSYTSTHERDA